LFAFVVNKQRPAAEVLQLEREPVALLSLLGDLVCQRTIYRGSLVQALLQGGDLGLEPLQPSDPRAQPIGGVLQLTDLLIDADVPLCSLLERAELVYIALGLGKLALRGAKIGLSGDCRLVVCARSRQVHLRLPAQVDSRGQGPRVPRCVPLGPALHLGDGPVEPRDDLPHGEPLSASRQ